MSEAAEQPAPPPEEPFPDIFQVLNDDADFDFADSEGQSLDALDQDQAALEGGTDLQEVIDQLNELDGAGEESEPRVFIVQVGTDGSWTEQVPLNGTLVPASSGTVSDYRYFTATDTASGAGLIQLAANQAVAIQYEDIVSTSNSVMRFIQISPPAGGTNFITKLAKNMGVNATLGVCSWAYTFGVLGGGTLSILNTREAAGIVGSPGSLGVIITSNGSDGLTTGGCPVRPAGISNIYEPIYQVSATSSYYFTFENSAG